MHKAQGLTKKRYIDLHSMEIDLYNWMVLVIACSTGSLSMLDAP